MGSVQLVKVSYARVRRICLSLLSLIRNAPRTVMSCLPWRRVPVILQLSALECGAACLAMILTYYGRHTRITDCRAACGVGRDGLTAWALVKAAQQYGLRAKAFSLELAEFEHVPLPAIVHWNFNHFVVVERWSSQGVEIIDPAVGRRRVTADEFDAGFTGVVLALEPGIQFEPHRRSHQSALRTYLAQMSHIPGVPIVLAQVLGASLCIQVFGLALPVATKVLIDHILRFHMTNLMTLLGLGMAMVVLMQMVTTYLRATLLIYLRGRLDPHVMLNFVEHLFTLPLQYFQQRTSGDLLMRLGSNTVIREVLTTQAVSAILDSVLVLGYLSILAVQSPFFAALVLSIGLLQLALLLTTTRRVRNLTDHELSAQAQSQSSLIEALMGIVTLKASGAEDRALDHWSRLFFKHLNISLQRSHLLAVIDTAMMALRTSAPLILLWAGALQVLDGSMSLGTALALNALSAACLAPLASLVTNGQGLQLVGAHLERMTDVWEAEPEQRLLDVEPAPPLAGRIELHHVGFRYDSHAPWVLRDISVTIEPGQKIALVGRTGSGKSTLAMLLLGLYQPTNGDILYDGQPFRHLNYRSLRSQFGVVLQEAFVFSGSIRENIAFNTPGLALDRVKDAARLAAIDDEIMQMPMGYETWVAEGGSGLSGGQRQRLAIARALARTPAILMLDEATSHLDVVTEGWVDQHLSRLACTRIVIAHRLSTIRNADQILVLDAGTIVERGSHAELLAREGYYAALVHSQLEAEEAAAMPGSY